MTSEFDPMEAAQAASEPGTFSFIDRLVGRNYPTSEVYLYLDEQAAYDRLHLIGELNQPTSVLTPEDRVRMEGEIAALEKTLLDGRYTVTLQGFPPEQYDEILEEVNEQYPIEYTEYTNMFSGEKVKNEVDNPERTKLLLSMLWAKSIVKIEDPHGAVDDAVLDNGTAARMRGNSPIDARRRIDIRIQELRLASAWMDEIQDEGFLATP